MKARSTTRCTATEIRSDISDDGERNVHRHFLCNAVRGCRKVLHPRDINQKAGVSEMDTPYIEQEE